MAHGCCEFIRAPANLAFQGNRRLEQRERVLLLVHRPLHAVDQCFVDPPQTLDIVDLIGGHRRSVLSGSLKAIPVKVWFRCIEMCCPP